MMENTQTNTASDLFRLSFDGLSSEQVSAVLLTLSVLHGQKTGQIPTPGVGYRCEVVSDRVPDQPTEVVQPDAKPGWVASEPVDVDLYLVTP